jgi:hypothetical protein
MDLLPRGMLLSAKNPCQDQPPGAVLEQAEVPSEGEQRDKPSRLGGFMVLYELKSDSIVKIEATTFDAVGVRERTDLQRLLRERIEVVAPDTMVVTEEFGEWDDSKRRIDLLALDREANLVIIELKRTEDGGHMELQAIRYAAMVSTMTFDQVASTHEAYLQKIGRPGDARASILEFLGWDHEDNELFAQDVRIVLASAEFSKELTTAVMWLNERDLDIRCIRIKPHRDGERVLIDVQQVMPLPEAQEYQVRVREKATQERTARRGQGPLGDRYFRFWSQLLTKAKERTTLHRDISPSRVNWVAATSYGLYFSYVISHDSGRAELYLTRSEAAENKAIFRALEAKKSEIENSYGGSLSWQPLEHRSACRIGANVTDGSFNDEQTWPKLQADMIDAMIRLERALAPFIAKYRTGGKP